MRTIYYMGLDLSLTGSGIVVMDESAIVVHAETLKNKLMGMERLEFLRDAVNKACSYYCPDLICLEGYAMGSHSGQAFSIGELGGVIKLYLHERNFPYHLVPPTRLKKYITGRGIGEKDQMMLAVYKNFGYEPKDNNIADAFGLCHIAMTIGEEMTPSTQYQKEVIHGILNPDTPAMKKEKRAKKGAALKRRFPTAEDNHEKVDVIGIADMPTGLRRRKQ
jgi:crossover junction endodeoxyribonuclease RuvC